MPAVSTKMYSVPSRVTVSSTASRVVPAMGETMARSCAGEGVEQRGFAHVGAADDGHLDARRGRRVFRRRLPAREAGGHVVEQGIHADAVLGGNGKDVGDAEP